MKFGSTTAWIGLAFLISAASLSAAEEGWIDLFNGKNLEGWERKGGKANYEVLGGTLVGSSVPDTGNSFLCTKRDFTNFVLEFEFKGHPKLNSGVQIRSHSLPGYRNGRVHGYQIELEQEDRDRGWSAGLYDEARRGWLYPNDKEDPEFAKRFGEEGDRLWKRGQWNHVRVEANGPSIKTWLNGEPRVDIEDDMTPTGFIALQVHGVGDNEEKLSVSWRKIRIRELP